MDYHQLLRCFRCGCPVAYCDHCHCSSPNLRTRPQDTSITTHSSPVLALMRPLTANYLTNINRVHRRIIRNTLSFCLFLSFSFSHLKNQSHNKHASNAYENIAIKSRARTAFVFRCTPTRDRLSVNDYYINYF